MATDLSPAAAERLALLVEELGEALQVVGKCLRHGMRSCDPTGAVSGMNAMRLQCELGDVFAAIELLTTSSDISRGSVETASTQKLKKLRRWLHEPENLALVETVLLARAHGR